MSMCVCVARGEEGGGVECGVDRERMSNVFFLVSSVTPLRVLLSSDLPTRPSGHTATPAAANRQGRDHNSGREAEGCGGGGGAGAGGGHRVG